MDMNTLINSCVEALANSVALDQWCRIEYSRAPEFYLNYDENNLPDADGCPAVFVLPAAKQYGGPEFSDALDVICMIHDQTVRVHPTIATIYEYTGVRNVESMRKQVVSVISGEIGQTASSRITLGHVEYDTITEFPFMTVSMVLTIKTPYTIGSGDPFATE